MDRGLRRSLTLCAIRRRCETPFAPPGREPHRYAKSTPLGHCHKRIHGKPKIDSGMCCTGCRDRVYHWRHQTRELRNLANYGLQDWESDMVARMESPK